MMGIYNEILAPRYARMLQKLFGMKGPVPVKQLSGEISTTINLFNGCENRYLESWERFAFLQEPLAGGAGNFGQIRFRNPAGSNMVAVVESLLISTSGAGSDALLLTKGTTNADLGSFVAMTNTNLDVRTRPTPTIIASFSNNTAQTPLAVNVLQLSLLAATSWQLISNENQEIPVFPGTALQLGSTVANQALFSSWIWRERFLEDSERA